MFKCNKLKNIGTKENITLKLESKNGRNESQIFIRFVERTK